jgi:hypothetical protein
MRFLHAGPPHRHPGACGALLAAFACTTAAGCGSSVGAGTASRRPAASAPARITPTSSTATGSGRTHASSTAGERKRSIVAKVDVSSDRVLAEGKVHIAAGAPTDAEVKREIEAAKKHGAKLPSGESVAAFEAAEAQSQGPAAEAETPLTPWNPRLKPIAAWIVPVLAWAYEHGWRGTVTSGYRTLYEQAQLNAAGAFSAPAGYSNHETTGYPGGAVDVTSPGQLITVLRGYASPRRLIGGVLGPVDPEHFSATGD